MPKEAQPAKAKGKESVPAAGYYQRLEKTHGKMLDAMGSLD